MKSSSVECIYLHAFEMGSETRGGIGRWIGLYNQERPNSSLGGRTPDEAYRGSDPLCWAGLRPDSGKDQTADCSLSTEL